MGSEIQIRGRILKWGNSYGVRIRKEDAKRLGVRPGDDVSLDLHRSKSIEEVLARLPQVAGHETDVSVRHDEYLGQARSEKLRRIQGKKEGGDDDPRG